MDNNEERTFTQEEVNRIVSERLARERAKLTADLEEREKAIKAREISLLASEKLSEAGLPKELISVLKYDDEASLTDAITKLSSLRGFSTEKKTDAEKRKIIENKLIDGEHSTDDVNQIRDAFKIKLE